METAALHCEDWASILCGANGDTTRLKEKLAKLEEEVKRLEAIEKEMLAAPDQQISFTIPIPARWRPAGAALVWSATTCKRPSIRRTI